MLSNIQSWIFTFLEPKILSDSSSIIFILSFKTRIKDHRKQTRTVKIRDGTEEEELVEVKREFVYELRNKGGTNTCTGIGQPVYYDIAIMELGKESIIICPVLLHGTKCFLPSKEKTY